MQPGSVSMGTTNSPFAAPAKVYSLKHVLAAAFAAVVLTATTMHFSLRPSAPHYTVPARLATYAHEAAVAPYNMMAGYMPSVVHGFRPTNVCSTFIGKGMCAGLMEGYAETVIRQCANDLHATPTVCECGSVQRKGDNPIVFVDSEVLEGGRCTCKFRTVAPGKGIWSMVLKCH